MHEGIAMTTMKIANLFALTLLLTMGVRADPIITSNVSCHSYQAQLMTDTSICEQGGPLNTLGASPSYAFANTQASVLLQGAASDALTISMKSTVNAVDGSAYLLDKGLLPPNVLFAPTQASASIHVHVDSYTLGAVRPGIVQVEWAPLWQGSYGDWYGTAGYTLQDELLYGGALTGTCTGSYGLCSGPGPNTPPIPFQLGTPFAFDGYADLHASSIDGVANGYDGLLVQFRFYEADGVTSVLSYDPPTSVPEPNTLLFALLGLIVSVRKWRGTWQ